MDEKKLSESISLIDDDLIEEADTDCLTKERKTGINRNIYAMAASAAAMIIALGAVMFVRKNPAENLKNNVYSQSEIIVGATDMPDQTNINPTGTSADNTAEVTETVTEIPEITTISEPVQEEPASAEIDEATDPAQNDYTVIPPEIYTDSVTQEIPVTTEDIKDADGLPEDIRLPTLSDFESADVLNISVIISKPDSDINESFQEKTVTDTEKITGISAILNQLTPEEGYPTPQWYIDGWASYNSNPSAYNREDITLTINFHDGTSISDIIYQPFIGNGFVSGMAELTPEQNTELRELIG